MDKYKELLTEMLKSPEIKKLYDDYIVKDITFKEWVLNSIDRFYIKRI